MEDSALYKSLKLFIPGWKNIVKVDYAIVKMHNQLFLVWYVNDIKEFKFKIPYKNITSEVGSEYHLHFIKTLNILRNDIISWYEEGLPEEWMQKYYDLFSDSIIF